MTPPLKKQDWTVRLASVKEGRPLVEQAHYARGASKTATHVFVLELKGWPGLVAGVTWWLPPTRAAALSVDRENPNAVLSLSRMVVAPWVPPNACTFMLARSVRHIRREGRWKALLTYADEGQGHEGGVYLAAGWEYVGRTKPSQRWESPQGKQASIKAGPKTRTPQEMAAAGYVRLPDSCKHKFILRLS